MSGRHTRQGLAALLSAILPGLGQVYNREWAKGAGFLLGIILLDAVLGVSTDTVKLLQGAMAGSAAVDSGTLLLRMLPLLGLAVWSIADAARHAKPMSV